MFSEFGNQIINAARLKRVSVLSTFTASNTTASNVLFTVTGSVWIHGIWGEVTTNISSNHTAGHLRLNDQTATIDITEAATGITLSSLLVGTLFYKESLTAVALKLKDNAAGTFEEPAAAGTPSMSQFVVGKKTGATTTIDYRYSTTNTPATGAVRFHALYLPLSSDGLLS